jgi:hypothetical protein
LGPRLIKIDNIIARILLGRCGGAGKGASDVGTASMATANSFFMTLS